MSQSAPFIPSKAKSLIQCEKNSGNVILEYLTEQVFHIFPILQLIVWMFSDTCQNFRGLCYNIYFKLYATSKMELSLTRNGNSWELLLIVVIESFVLNVTGLSFKCSVTYVKIRQQKILSDICMFKVGKKFPTRTTCQIYSKLTLKTSKRCLVHLSLTLNIFRTSLYCHYC